MADQEHGFESPEGHRLCVNNCGFLGSPATQNMCSKCYRDILKHGSVEAVEPTRQTTTASTSLKPVEEDASSEGPLTSSAKARPAAQTAPAAAAAGRCATCRKRIGLTGFRCRCGTTFCGVHRYPEKHGCTFDYKAVGREALARENPVVKASKLYYKI